MEDENYSSVSDDDDLSGAYSGSSDSRLPDSSASDSGNSTDSGGTDSSRSDSMRSDSMRSDSGGSDSERSNSGRGSKRRNLGDGGLRRLDLISKLPNSLLLDILSLLPAKDVVPTTILSKRWQGLWKFTPVLNICYCDYEEEEDYMDLKSMRRFLSSVNYTLLLYQSPKIDKFSVTISYMSSFSYDIDAWLLFALRKNVQELILYLEDPRPSLYRDTLNRDNGQEDDDGSWYALPPFLFNSSSLVTLKISKCRFEEGQTLVIKWKLLKVLSIKYVSLSNNLIQHIFSGCPSLESLELSLCYDFNYIESSNLRELVIHNYDCMPDDEDVEGVLKISAPYLRSLEISGDVRAHRLSLINSSMSLVNANISFNLETNEPNSERSRQMYTNNLQGLLDKFCHVKYLTIGSWCLQVLSEVEEKALLFPFSNLVSLTLHTRLKGCDRPGITRLLVLTPLLDTLVIDMDAAGSSARLVFEQEFLKSEDDASGGNYWASQKSSLEIILRNLKTVTIVDFRGSEHEMEFIAFMLNNAKQLQKMIIQRRKLRTVARRSFDAMCVAERLLSFPRCSSRAVILFYEIPRKCKWSRS